MNATDGFTDSKRGGSYKPVIQRNEGTAANMNDPMVRTRNQFMHNQESVTGSAHSTVSNINARTMINFRPLNMG